MKFTRSTSSNLLVCSLSAVLFVVIGEVSVDAAPLINNETSWLSVDVSELTSVDTWKCLMEKHYTRGIVRAFRSNNKTDPIAAETIRNMRKVGMNTSDIDIYMFPHPSHGHAARQINRMLDALEVAKVKYTRLWLDIEDTVDHAYWGTDTARNQQWTVRLQAAAIARVGSERVGIYSSHTMWERIFGNATFNCCAAQPLWYSEYSYGPSFKNFKPFGGWTVPMGKQFEGSTALCKGSFDLNYFNTAR